MALGLRGRSWDLVFAFKTTGEDRRRGLRAPRLTPKTEAQDSKPLTPASIMPPYHAAILFAICSFGFRRVRLYSAQFSIQWGKCVSTATTTHWLQVAKRQNLASNHPIVCCDNLYASCSFKFRRFRPRSSFFLVNRGGGRRRLRRIAVAGMALQRSSWPPSGAVRARGCSTRDCIGIRHNAVVGGRRVE